MQNLWPKIIMITQKLYIPKGSMMCKLLFLLKKNDKGSELICLKNLHVGIKQNPYFYAWKKRGTLVISEPMGPTFVFWHHSYFAIYLFMRNMCKIVITIIINFIWRRHLFFIIRVVQMYRQTYQQTYRQTYR